MSDTTICDFCGATNVPMIKGMKGSICFDCVNACTSTVNKIRSNKTKLNEEFKPSFIKKLLDDYVVEQNFAKEKIAVAIYNHYKMNEYILKNEGNPPVDIEKSNVILVGPTGSGKTYLLKTLCKHLGIPLAISDATTLTEAGYVGEDVENCVRKLVEASNGDIKKAERGIIYIDEIDKIGRKSENPSLSKDVSGEGVQQALLRLVEGTIAEIPPKGGRKHPEQSCMKIDTTNILFIIGGSFEGIEKIIAKRKQGKNSMGFGSKVIDKNNIEFNDYIKNVSIEDLKSFGMIPEFLGRFPIIAPLERLNEEALIKILTEPKNSLIKQYTELLKIDSVDLKFKKDALFSIAKKAIERKTGARGLRAILDEILLSYMYKIPDDESIASITITKEVVEQSSEALIKYKKAE